MHTFRLVPLRGMLTRERSFADADRYPYQQDWSVRPSRTLSAELNLGNRSSNCPHVVKVRAWAPELAKCGLSLDALCMKPEGRYSMDTMEGWLAWKQGVLNIGPDCAALLHDLEVCCDERDHSLATREDADPWLRQIPFSDFREALFDCVESLPDSLCAWHHVENFYTADVAGPVTQRRVFSLKSLCDRLLFSEHELRPYLWEVYRSCLAPRLYSDQIWLIDGEQWQTRGYPASGSYFEPEAYLSEMCIEGPWGYFGDTWDFPASPYNSNGIMGNLDRFSNELPSDVILPGLPGGESCPSRRPLSVTLAPEQGVALDGTGTGGGGDGTGGDTEGGSSTTGEVPVADDTTCRRSAGDGTGCP